MRPERNASGPELQHEIEQFLYLEAELLDEGRFHEWYELLADDVHYWMPVRENRLRRERDRELGGPTDLAYFDDDKQTLGQRIRRLDTGMAWAEDPPSRTRHVIGNVRIHAGAAEGEFEVTSAFLLYRTRLETDLNLFAGRRDDVLRRADDGWRIARRRIVLDQNVILSKNLSVFF
jgi:3-phenylpropionate/cinnamic acid dioxygenase small subunit